MSNMPDDEQIGPAQDMLHEAQCRLSRLLIAENPDHPAIVEAANDVHRAEQTALAALAKCGVGLSPNRSEMPGRDHPTRPPKSLGHSILRTARTVEQSRK